MGRSLIGRLIVGALCLLVFGGLLAACGSGGSGSSGSAIGASPDGGEESVSTVEVAGGPGKPIKEFTWNLPFGEPASLDPVRSYNYSENSVLSNICESLLKLNPKGEVVPALAEKVENPSPTTWVYTLHQGVKFFSGKSMTAADVVANLERQIDPKVGSFYYGPWGEEIAGVKAVGKSKVEVTTKRPNFLVNEMMATALGAVVNPESFESQGSKFGSPGSTLDCTGPFELGSWQPGSSIELVRNENYWDAPNAAKAEKVTFRFLTEGSQIANALTTGEIDGTYEAPVSALSTLSSSSEGKIFYGPTTEFLTLVPTENEGPTKDAATMRALSAVIERSAISSVIYQDSAIPMEAFATADGNTFGEAAFRAHEEEVAEEAPDEAEAKKLVEEAGTAGETLRLAIAAGTPEQARLANVLAGSAEKIGLKLSIQELPPGEFVALFTEPAARKPYDMLLAPTFSDVPDILETFSLAALPGSLQNVPGFDDPKITQGIRQAQATTDGEKRAPMLVDLDNQILASHGIGIPVIRTFNRLFLNNKLTGAPVRFPYQYEPWAAQIGAAN